MRSRRPGITLTVLALVCGLASAVPVAASSASPGPAAVTSKVKLAWKPCRDRSLPRGLECSTLKVPLDHDDPTGPKITLAVSRLRHNVGPGRGAVFTNPGGPGAPGRYLAIYGSYVPDKQGRRYDWYGMDPRGVGASTPRLSCDGSYFAFARKPYKPSSKKIEKYWLKRTAAYADDCSTSGAKALLTHMRTEDLVADLERFREAIGVEKVTYYGASYGTYLGQVYTTLHPDRIKAMVLAGVVDPTRVWYDSNLDQDLGFERTIGLFFAWVARNNRLYGLGKTRAAVTGRYESLLKRLARRPAERRIGPAELSDALVPAAYGNDSWPYIAGSLADLANRHRAAGIISLYRGSNPVGRGADQGYAAYLATICTDSVWPADYETWEKDNRKRSRKAPFLTWNNAWYNMPCRTWPAPSAPPVTVSGERFTGPVLLVSDRYDAPTPLSGAYRVRELFPSSRLIVGKNGTTHASALNGIACVDDAIAALLAHGSLPKRKSGTQADRICPALRAPVLHHRVAAPMVTPRATRRGFQAL